MALFGRNDAHASATAAPPAAPAVNGDIPRRAEMARYELKTRVHRQLIERLDLTKLNLMPPESVQQQIRRIVEDMLVDDETPLSRQERDQIVIEVQHETFGLGPIEPLMQDPTVNDILVNGPRDERSPPPAEQPELPVGIETAVAYPSSLEQVPPRQVEARLAAPAPEGGLDLLAKGVRHALVRVEREDPVPVTLAEREVLLGTVPVPSPEEDPIGELAGDRHRLVARAGVDDHELIRPLDAFQAGAQPLLLVQHHDRHRQARHRVPRAQRSNACAAPRTASTDTPSIRPFGLWIAATRGPYGPFRRALVGP